MKRIFDHLMNRTISAEAAADIFDARSNVEKYYERKYEYIKTLRGPELDSYIFNLKCQRNITEYQRKLLIKADIAYLRDEEEKSANYLADAYKDIDKNISQIINAAFALDIIHGEENVDASIEIIKQLDDLHKAKEEFKRKLDKTIISINEYLNE